MIVDDTVIEWECSRCGVKFNPTKQAMRQRISRNQSKVYCCRYCLDNKSVHPTDSSLFLCSVCETYKHKDEFYKKASGKHGVTGFCKKCYNEKQAMYFNASQDKYRKTRLDACRKRRASADPNILREKNRREYVNNREARVASAVKYIKKRRVSDPEWAKNNRRKYKTKLTKEVRDSYIKNILRLQGIQETPEMIELKRQGLLMKRTLKQLKERIKNESNCQHV